MFQVSKNISLYHYYFLIFYNNLFLESSPTGRILVVNTAGITVTNLEINGPEISGMTIA